MKTPADFAATIRRLALLAVVIPVLFACGNDSEQPATTGISMRALQRQLGYVDDPSSSSLIFVETEATTKPLVVAIVAMVVRSRTIAQGPYSDRTPITDLETQLEDDLRNSADFVVLENLESAPETIEIELPPPSAEKWQLAAVAFSTQPDSVEALGEPVHQDAVIFIGFNDNFLKTTPDGGVTTLDGANVADANGVISIPIQRACLINQDNPPKGCAQFNTDRIPVVTSAVEIIRVNVNGANVAGTFPIIVRKTPDTGLPNEVDVTTAAAALAALPGVATASNVEVFTTHLLAAKHELTPCSDLDGTNPSAAALEAACIDEEGKIESYFTPIQ